MITRNNTSMEVIGHKTLFRALSQSAVSKSKSPFPCRGHSWDLKRWFISQIPQTATSAQLEETSGRSDRAPSLLPSTL